MPANDCSASTATSRRARRGRAARRAGRGPRGSPLPPRSGGRTARTRAAGRPRPCRRRWSCRRSPWRPSARGRRGAEALLLGGGRHVGGRALHLVGELAERAHRPRRDLAAARALVQLHRLGPLERGARLLEKAEEEVVLGPGRRLLHAVEDLLVRDGGGALGERALLDDVVDAAQERVGRRLALGQAVERLHAPDQLGVRGGQRRRLARQRVRLPVPPRAEQRRGLAVPVVAGGPHRHAVLEGRTVPAVALQEVGGAEGGVVPPEHEGGRAAALAALHRTPPDITGRSSITSSSRSIWSAVTRSSPRITSTVSGRMSSSRRTSLTRRLPATSTSRRGLRSTTFMLKRRGTPAPA